MAPAIPVGALLSIRVAPGADCHTGDVVIFLDRGRLIAHRIVLELRFGGWHWLLEKGDANPGGTWRQKKTVRGSVLGFTLPDQPMTVDLADPALAARSLRQHCKYWIKSLGGLRADKQEY